MNLVKNQFPVLNLSVYFSILIDAKIGPGKLTLDEKLSKFTLEAEFIASLFRLSPRRRLKVG